MKSVDFFPENPNMQWVYIFVGVFGGKFACKNILGERFPLTQYPDSVCIFNFLPWATDASSYLNICPDERRDMCSQVQ